MALAGAGGAAVVQMMVSDGWESAKGRLARLLGRGTPAEVTAMEDRLESARTQLASLPEHELEQAMRVQAAVWQERLVDLLEAAPEVEEELRGLVGRVDARQGTTGVRQQAVLLSGIQINRFSAPPSLDEAIGTIAVPAGRRYEDAPLRGRDELIAELVEALSRPGSAERVHLLHGLGGAGKSSVALEVACRVQEKGAGVWWIPASDAGRVTMGMLNLARRLRLSDAEIAHRDVADLIWERLADRDTPWLLVFDNADDPAVLTIDDAPLPDGTGWLRPVATAAGMAIVTSRHGRVPDWGGWCRAHDVGMLTPAEGAQVLLDGTGSKAGSRADAESLSRRLGGLPLALRLAGSYLAQSQQMPRIFADPERARTFAEYRSALDVDPPEAGFPSQQVQVSDREARQMLGRTWELSLELLERRGTGPVRALLNLLSCFADAPIPYEMLLLPRLLAESEIFPSSTTGGEIWQSLVALSDTGLLDLDSPSHEEDIPVLRLHPLVRDVSRPREQEDRYLTTAAKVLVGATHGEQSGLPEDPAKWEVWQFLVPHARQVLDAVSALPRLGRQARLDSAKAAYMSGRHLASTGAYAQARAVYAEVFAIRSRLLGLDHEDTLSAHYGIARMAAGQGRYGEAETAFREILASRERILGPGHPDILNARYGVARMAAAQGRYHEAEQVYRDILAEGDRTMGPGHPETLRAQYGIARMAGEQGRFSEAETIYRELLSTQETNSSAPFSDHPEHLESKTVYREVLAVEERVLGPDQPDTLTIRYAIARMAAAQGRHDEAERAYREVLLVEEETLGPDHPDTLTTCHWVARMVLAQGRHEDAERLFRQVLATREEVLGVDHPNTLMTRYWVARTLETQGRRREAEELLRSVLRGRRRVLGADHPHIDQTLQALEKLNGDERRT
ncbi:tetratricopeptide repeat protein [Actinomadura madurae]|uniref:tetratricopeptide repeat protein n=1 Tax=Actinomadura madurae TaxID=1993 RepID=UPI002025CEDC|nr:tetratricopeptide repeat protein [Actinomadura madurae]URM98963.1 tetratricopeptide repeat protein [Actinomadura madurae]